MATLKMQGLEEFERMLSKLSSLETVESICGNTIYEGAKIVADAISAEIDALPTVDPRSRGTESRKLDGLTSLQKKGLADGFGITPMRNEGGYYNVKLGFDGYNQVKTKKYPSGQPNVMIARSINSGTSFRAKNAFVDRAVRSSRKQAEEVMLQTAESEFQKLTKG